MNCKEAFDFLMDYLDGGLTPEQRRDFDQHLRECPSCVRYLDSYRTTVALASGAYERPEPPKTMPQGIMNAVRAALRRPR